MGQPALMDTGIENNDVPRHQFGLLYFILLPSLNMLQVGVHRQPKILHEIAIVFWPLLLLLLILLPNLLINFNSPFEYDQAIQTLFNEVAHRVADDGELCAEIHDCFGMREDREDVPFADDLV